jgi:uncharacterized protein
MCDESVIKFETLIIPIERIGDDGLDVDVQLPAKWLLEVLGSESLYRPEEPGALRVHLSLVDNVVHVRGKASVSLAADCVRCLAPQTLPVDAQVEVSLFEAGSEPQPGTDGELAGDDMGVSTYTGKVIDLGQVVHDEVLLALPMNPLCTETCKGLCSRCGQDLNQAMCVCGPEDLGPWEALKHIKVKKQSNED